MSALDSMLSQYNSMMGGAKPTAPVAAAPASRPPNSFFSAVPSAPSSVGASSISQGFSPFGVQNIPDLSQADPNTLARLSGAMQGSIYSFPAGGYIHSDYTAGPGTNYGQYYIGGNPPANRISPLSGGGGDPAMNRAAMGYFNYIGTLPTRARGTSALNQLTGSMPGTGPSLNTQVGGNYGGPFAFPGWNMGNLLNG